MMKSNMSAGPALHGVLAALGLVAVAAPSYAQPMDEVVVETTRAPNLRRADLSAPVVVISVTRRVSYKDLDLVSYAGATELENRVNTTARAVCKQLNARYRMTAGEHQTCVRDAVRGGMEQARAAIAAAEQKMRSA